MKMLHWQGFYFTVQGGTPYFVKLHPQLIKIKDEDTAKAVLAEWKKQQGVEA